MGIGITEAVKDKVGIGNGVLHTASLVSKLVVGERAGYRFG